MDGTGGSPYRYSTDGGSASDRVTLLDVNYETEESSSSEDDNPPSNSKTGAQAQQSGSPTMHSRPASPPIAIAATDDKGTSARNAVPTPAPGSLSPHLPLTASPAPASCPVPRRQAAKVLSPLIMAAKKGEVARIDSLLTQKHGVDKSGRDTTDSKAPDVDASDEDGCTALHHAAAKGNSRALLALLQHGARTDLLTSKGATALMLAAKKGRGVAVEILLEHASCSVSATSDSESSMSMSSEKSNIYHHEAAARRYKDLAEADRQKKLCKAVPIGDSSTAARMIAAGGMDIEHPDELGNTLLGYAARSGDEHMVRLLLCAGAKVNGINPDHTSPLMHAVLAQQLTIIAVLRQAGASVVQKRADGESALTLAMRVDSTSIMQALVDNKIGFLSNGSETLLALAVQFRSRNIAGELLTSGADLLDKDGSRALAVCAKKGDLTGLKFLLGAGADPNHRSYDGHTAFTLAAANGHVGVVHELLAHCKQAAGANAGKAMLALLKQADRHGRTALMLAALKDHTLMVEFLLKQGADLHTCDINGLNALLWAVAKAGAGMVNLLSNHRATHLLFDHAGNSGIMIAAAYDNLPTLKVLLTPVYANELYNLNTPNKQKETALTIAAARGNEQIVRELLQARANVLHVNAAGCSAKLEAAAHGHAAIVDLLELAEQSVVASSRSVTGILAPLARIPVLGPLLLQVSSVKIPEVDTEGNSALALAARHGHMDMVTRLVKAADSDPDSSLSTIQQMDALALLRGNDSDNSDNGLLTGWERPATAIPIDIDRQNSQGLTPLCLAVANGREDVVRVLLEHGALVNHASHDRITPLWLAATMPEYRPAALRAKDSGFTQERGDAMIQLLFDSGAGVNASSINAQTPLHAAAISGRLAAVKLLISGKADINLRDVHGICALGHAAGKGHIHVVEYLLSQGASPHAAPGMHSPLTRAAANGHDAIIMLLAQHGANVNHTGVNGRSALIAAAFHGRASTVAVLLKLGAELHHTCQDGYTAREHAIKAGHAGIVALLRAGHPAPRDN